MDSHLDPHKVHLNAFFQQFVDVKPTHLVAAPASALHKQKERWLLKQNIKHSVVLIFYEEELIRTLQQINVWTYTNYSSNNYKTVQWLLCLSLYGNGV